MSSRIRTVIANPTSSRRFYGYLNSGSGAWLNPGAQVTLDYDLRATLKVAEREALDRDVKNNKVVYKIQFLTVDETGSCPINAANASVAEYGSSVYHKTVINLNNANLVLTDASTNGGFGSLQLYQFPHGLIHFTSALVNATATKVGAGIIDTWSGNFSLGSTAITAGTQALDSTRADFLASVAIPAATSGTANVKGFTASSLAGVNFDGTSTSVSVNLNVKVPDASISANDSINVTGQVILVWTLVGDI